MMPVGPDAPLPLLPRRTSRTPRTDRHRWPVTLEQAQTWTFDPTTMSWTKP